MYSPFSDAVCIWFILLSTTHAQLFGIAPLLLPATTSSWSSDITPTASGKIISASLGVSADLSIGGALSIGKPLIQLPAIPVTLDLQPITASWSGLPSDSTPLALSLDSVLVLPLASVNLASLTIQPAGLTQVTSLPQLSAIVSQGSILLNVPSIISIQGGPSDVEPVISELPLSQTLSDLGLLPTDSGSLQPEVSGSASINAQQSVAGTVGFPLFAISSVSTQSKIIGSQSSGLSPGSIVSPSQLSLRASTSTIVSKPSIPGPGPAATISNTLKSTSSSRSSSSDRPLQSGPESVLFTVRSSTAVVATPQQSGILGGASASVTFTPRISVGLKESLSAGVSFDLESGSVIITSRLSTLPTPTISTVTLSFQGSGSFIAPPSLSVQTIISSNRPGLSLPTSLASTPHLSELLGSLLPSSSPIAAPPQLSSVPIPALSLSKSIFSGSSVISNLLQPMSSLKPTFSSSGPIIPGPSLIAAPLQFSSVPIPAVSISKSISTGSSPIVASLQSKSVPIPGLSLSKSFSPRPSPIAASLQSNSAPTPGISLSKSAFFSPSQIAAPLQSSPVSIPIFSYSKLSSSGLVIPALVTASPIPSISIGISSVTGSYPSISAPQINLPAISISPSGKTLSFGPGSIGISIGAKASAEVSAAVSFQAGAATSRPTSTTSNTNPFLFGLGPVVFTNRPLSLVPTLLTQIASALSSAPQLSLSASATPLPCFCDSRAPQGVYCGYCSQVTSCQKGDACWTRAFGCNSLCIDYGVVAACLSAGLTNENKTFCPIWP